MPHYLEIKCFSACGVCVYVCVRIVSNATCAHAVNRNELHSEWTFEFTSFKCVVTEMVHIVKTESQALITTHTPKAFSDILAYTHTRTHNTNRYGLDDMNVAHFENAHLLRIGFWENICSIFKLTWMQIQE